MASGDELLRPRIRQEGALDRALVEELVEAAFATMEMADGTEHELVARLRESDAFVPELSLVAEVEGRVVGHILLTKLIVELDAGGESEGLSLAPVSVLPEFQRRGIGAALITKGHEIARHLGFAWVFLVGHPDYYPRFGYRPASDFGVRVPFPAPDEACMALELSPGALEGAVGTVRYPPEFGLSVDD